MRDQILAILQKYGATMTPDALRQADAELRALGWTQQFNSAGEPRGRLFGPGGQTVDLGDFGGNWQWVDRGFSGGGDPANPGDPNVGGLSTGPGDGTGGSASGGGGTTITPGSGGLLNGLQGVPAGVDPRTYFLEHTPGYQFAYDQVLKAGQRSAASRGTLLTMGTQQALARNAAGLASNRYDTSVGQYMDLAKLGAGVATTSF